MEQARNDVAAVHRPAHQILPRTAGWAAARVPGDGDRGIAGGDASGGLDGVAVGDRESQHDPPSSVGRAVGEEQSEQPHLLVRQRVGEEVRAVRVPSAMVWVATGSAHVDCTVRLIDEPVDRGPPASDEQGDLVDPKGAVPIQLEDAVRLVRRHRSPTSA
jgi:hypothetical protein